MFCLVALSDKTAFCLSIVPYSGDDWVKVKSLHGTPSTYIVSLNLLSLFPIIESPLFTAYESLTSANIFGISPALWVPEAVL